jgi:uncharacterized protein (TIGR02246 family)
MPQTARQVIEHLLETVKTNDRDQMADCYAPDVVIEMPFMADQVPAGREALRARMHAAAPLWRFDDVRDVRLTETVDPDVIVAEYRIEAVMVPTGEKLSIPFVAIMTVKDGLVTHSRDYTDTAATAELVKAAAAVPNAE